MSSGRFQDYEVEEDRSICRSTKEPEILEYATFSKIRVFAYDGAKWIIDPRVDGVKEHWKLRVFEKKPLIRLQWDPGEFWWKDPFDQGRILFILYRWRPKEECNILVIIVYN